MAATNNQPNINLPQRTITITGEQSARLFQATIRASRIDLRAMQAAMAPPAVRDNARRAVDRFAAAIGRFEEELAQVEKDLNSTDRNPKRRNDNSDDRNNGQTPRNNSSENTQRANTAGRGKKRNPKQNPATQPTLAASQGPTASENAPIAPLNPATQHSALESEATQITTSADVPANIQAL